MFSDDNLMDVLVLKGGSSLEIVYDVATRSSIDLDFSIPHEFDDLHEIATRMRRVLEATFSEVGYKAFDVKIQEKPPAVSEDLRDFWGGYEVGFKLIESARHARYQSDGRELRRRAVALRPDEKRTFTIDISKHEYCEPKREHEIDGYTIYVYTPEMIVFEKLRAICQQMPEYRQRVRSGTQSARARDFVDIHALVERFSIQFASPESTALLKSIFEAKRVPLSLIGRIGDFRDYHRQDFQSVRDTV